MTYHAQQSHQDHLYHFRHHYRYGQQRRDPDNLDQALGILFSSNHPHFSIHTTLPICHKDQHLKWRYGNVKWKFLNFYV